MTLKQILSLISLTLSLAVASRAAAPKLLPFQGHLTDSTGKAVADGAKLIQFRIYDAPVAGSVAWAGEIHRTTVNAGLVNVQLGSRNRLDGVDFDRTLYLEITVDANGDNALTPEDPPLLPRQVLLPVIFATESARSRNSEKLAGFDWNPLLVDGNNPETGHLRGDKIQFGSIRGGQIGSNSIGSLHLTINAIQTAHLTNKAVVTEKLAEGAVTLQKLAAKEVNTSVGVGGFAISGPVTYSVEAAGKMVDVPDLKVTLVTTGRPVLLGLVPGPFTSDDPNLANQSNAAWIGVMHNTEPPGTSSATAGFAIYRNGTDVVSFERIRSGNFSVADRGIDVPAGSIRAIDLAALAKTNTYSIKVTSSDNRMNVVLNNVRLIAYEL